MSPRDRTRAHMQKLVAVAALAAGCSKKNEPGYGVVDPMPPPARCPGAAGAIRARATFVGTSVLLELDFASSPFPLFPKTEPQAGASTEITAHETTGSLMRMRLRHVGPGTGARVDVPLTCDSSGGGVYVELGWAVTPEGPPEPADAGLPPRDDSAFGPPTAGSAKVDAGPHAISVRLYDH